MTQAKKAWFVGGGIGSMSGAAFLIRDGGWQGSNITILEELNINGGSCDGSGLPQEGYLVRGGRMLNNPTYECTWDIFSSIPSLANPAISVREEIISFNEQIKTQAKARLVDSKRNKLNVNTMGFSMRDRLQLLKLTRANEDKMGASRIDEWFSPAFFKTNFWYMWATTFAFQTWHSAAELKRYMVRFMHEFPRIQTLEGVTRTPLNQYDSMVLPLQNWLTARGVNFVLNTRVTNLDIVVKDGEKTVTGIQCLQGDRTKNIPVPEGDLVFVTNGSMTEASSLGNNKTAPAMLGKKDGGAWTLWETLAKDRPEFGNPAAFDGKPAESLWESFTVTLRDPIFFNRMCEFSGNEAGTGALVTFKDSSWFMSCVLAKQPHFLNQPADVQVFWAYGLFPERVGDFVKKPMKDCTGEELLTELCGHLGFGNDLAKILASATVIPCMMPFITSQFMPRVRSDRPAVVPAGNRNLAFIGQYVEIPDDVVFTVEYSVRAAMIATYTLAGIKRAIPPVSQHHKTLKVTIDSLKTAFR